MAKKKTPFEKKFAKMQDNWEAGLEESGFTDIPPGTYQLQLQSAELRQAESSGNWMFMRKHLVLEGEFAGECVVDFMTLEGERSPFFTKMWIEQMGMEAPAKFTEVPAVVEEMVENHPKYTGQVTVSEEGYCNVKIKKLLEGEASLDEVESSSDWEVGSRVVVQFDGEPYPGEITSVDEESADVTFDNGDEETVALDDLEPEEEEETQEEEEEAAAPFEEGTRVLATIDGEEYAGEITSLDEESAEVTFDDGDEQSVAFTDLKLEEEEDSSDGDDEEEEQRAELLAFCQAQSVAGITDESSVEDLTAAIKKYEWAKSDLIKEEVELLEGIDAKFEKAKPKNSKKKAAKKKTSKKAKKKTAKKKASKKASKKKAKKKK